MNTREDHKHRSQLAGFIIDCQIDGLEFAAEFWNKALGYAVETWNEPEDAMYRSLKTGPDGLHIEVQQVDHQSRLHLDIDAEFTRLEALGAKRVAQVKRWWLMEAPTSQRFCVVRRLAEKFDQTANQWD